MLIPISVVRIHDPARTDVAAKLTDIRGLVRDTSHVSFRPVGIVIELSRLSRSEAKATYGLSAKAAKNKLRLVQEGPWGSSTTEESNHEDR